MASVGERAQLVGLTAADVAQRRARGEINVVAASTSRSYRRILFENAFTPINTILFLISIVLVVIGLPGDALMTAGLVMLNVVVGVVQEGRAKKRLDAIALLNRPKASVIRDGDEQEIDPSDIVLGDYVRVRPGDEVQVDGVVVEEDGLGCDESLLTGESDMVRKHVDAQIFSGSFCMTGTGVFEAQKVGADSMAQQLTTKARSFRNERTPLQREVSWIILGMAVAVALLGIAVVNSFVQVYGGLPLKETVRAAAVMVALVPQGLAFMVTVTYAMAAVRIAGVGALVQRLSAVESMSHVDVLCVDKTGTLTTNQLSLEKLTPLSADEETLKARLGTFAASVSVRNRTLDAVLDGCKGEARAFAAEVPFDSARKWSALVFNDGDEAGLYVLGAPEMVMPHVSDGAGVEAAAKEPTEAGLRVLLFAHAATADPDFDEERDLPEGMEALGLVVLRDELRKEARETVEKFTDTGVTLKVLSGDHPETVSSLARQVGIEAEGKTSSGVEVDALKDAAAVQESVERNTVFGRISPEHKEKLISALQNRNHYVAMIGDGVNDIPALKRANLAAAMRSGSPATRGVADIVLLNDSFAVLPAAFQEGQRIRNGMQTMIRLFLVRTLSFVLVILGASLLADPFPSTPRQAGIPAFLTVGIPVLVLAFSARPGRTAQYLLPPAMGFVVPAALSIGLLTTLVFHGFLELSGGTDAERLDQARTALTITAVLTGLCIMPFAQREGTDRSLPVPDPRLLALAGAMLLALALSFAIGPLRRFYELEFLTIWGYAAIVLAIVVWAAVLVTVWRTTLPSKLVAVGSWVLSKRVKS